MSFVDDAKYLAENGEVKEVGSDFLSDIIGALMGDPLSAGKAIIKLMQAPLFFRERLFWSKMEQYLDGVYVEEEDRAKLRARLTENGSADENAKRLIECIDRAETSRKIRYLINATRCLLTDFIDLETYFRICRAVTGTLDEDLQYLRDHLEEEDLPYNNNIQGLYSAGLMYSSVIGEDTRYSFTSLAFTVDRRAVSYDNDGRYPNPQAEASQKVPSIGIPTVTDEEVEKMLDDEFGSSKLHTEVEIPMGEF